jgi:kynurenine formamidase
LYVYPSHLKTVIWDFHSNEETRERFEVGISYQSKGLLMSDHGPTHVVALNPLDPREGARSIDEMYLSLFYDDVTCIGVSHKEPQSYSDDTVLDEAVNRSGVSVNEGDTLLLYTGTCDRYYGKAEFLSQYPWLDEAGSTWIVEKGIKIFGIDSPNPDNPTSCIYPCHMMCREHGITHYENLANLDQLVGKRFTFIGLPLRIRDGTDSPVRTVAVLDE